MQSLFIVLDMGLNLLVWFLIIGAVLNWLLVFGVLNARSRFVNLVGDLIFRITEPALRPIRRILPPINGVDLSPIILIFGIVFIRMLLREYGPL